MPDTRAMHAACLLLALNTGAAASEESTSAAPDEAVPTCLRLTQVRSSSVLDGQHILFTMRNGDLFLNSLPNRCPNLRRNTAWVNKVPAPEICDLGLIQVMIRIGGELVPGDHCSLGKFAPVLRPEVDELQAELKEAKAADEKP